MTIGKLKRLKLNNAGSSMIVTIVVVTFLSIIATIFLYMAGQNYIMKMTDRHNKESFYEAETGLEEMKAGLMEVAAEASNKAYVDTMVQYSIDEAFTRYSYFQTAYFEELEKLLNSYFVAAGGYEDYLKSLVEPKYRDAFSFDPVADDAFGHPMYIDDATAEDGYVFIRGINMVYVSDDGFTTVIKTDIVFSVPDMNWGVASSYRSLSETAEELHGSELVDSRRDYNISEYVNYYNWYKNSD